VSRGQPLGVLGLTNKITTSNINQEIAGIAADIIQEAGLVAPHGDGGGLERWNNQILGSIALSIAGGTSNIQRNIISERGLGLPRELADGGTSGSQQ
jgi:alkylation response protein AidB-like acyl-CoA dehydrogenase